MDFKEIFDKNLKKHKRHVVANKIYQYLHDNNKNTVDLPEFCKPYYERIDYQVRKELERIEKNGNLDKLYYQAMTS